MDMLNSAEFIFTHDQEKGMILYHKARFTVITENLIRCEISPRRNFCDFQTAFAVNRTYNGCKYEVHQADGVPMSPLTISTACMSITYKPDDSVTFTGENLYGRLSGRSWKYGDSNQENLGGTLSTLDGVEGYVKVEDGILSKDGWFVLDDSTNLVVENGWIKRNDKRNETDIYIFAYGRDYKKALRTLFYVSGKPALPRKYVFGSWYSRWWPYTDEEIIGIVEEYDAHDFPLDIMVIDMDWHHHDWTYRDNEECRKHRAAYGYGHATNLGWCGYSWNRNLIKHPQKMLEELHQRNIYVTLNDHPHDGVRTHEDAYEGFMKDMGLDPASGVNLEFDLGDPKYMEAFFKNVHEPLEKEGVDFWWVDWQQDEVKPYIKGTKARHLQWLNPTYFKHTAQNGKRGISYSRWGGFGDQKYPIYFSGDTKSTWECLQFQVEFTAQSSNAGLFYWGHDTGGFFGERDAEMYVRWTQFTGFSACLRVHSQRDKVLDRRPWMWGEEAKQAMRKIYHMRSQLMPYIYSVAYRAYEDEVPMIMPMYIQYPEEAKAYENNQQYMFGEGFLCAPITSPMENGKATQKVWIKEGIYYDYFTGLRYECGEHIFACPLDEFPLLVRGGMPIPMQPYTRRMTSEPLRELIVRCYPGKEGTFTLYEDDGISSRYLEGKCLKTRLFYQNQDGRITIEIEPFGEGYEGMPTVRDYRIELMCMKKKVQVVNGTECPVEYQNGRNVLCLKGRNIREKLTILLE